MKNKFFIIGTLFFFTSTNAQTVTIEDIKPIEGNWVGTLTYLDYSSNKEATIKLNLIVTIVTDKKYELNIDYPNEPRRSGKHKYQIKEKGTIINKMKIIERLKQPDGALKIVMESKGKDGNDNRKATFHHILLIAKNNFSITKLVKFDDEENFFQRNQFAYYR